MTPAFVFPSLTSAFTVPAYVIQATILVRSSPYLSKADRRSKPGLTELAVDFTITCKIFWKPDPAVPQEEIVLTFEQCPLTTNWAPNFVNPIHFLPLRFPSQ